MDSLYVGAARDLITACIDLQKLNKYIRDHEGMPPAFFMAIPGESAPLMTSLAVDDNDKISLSLGRGYHDLDEEFSRDPQGVSAFFFTCTIGTKDSLSDQALEWYDSIEYEPDGILYPEPLVYDDFFDSVRCPEAGEIICFLYAIKAVIELCKKGTIMTEDFRERRPTVFVSGHPSCPLIGIGEELFHRDTFAEVEALPSMDRSIRELPVIDTGWTVGAKKLGREDRGGQTFMVVELEGETTSGKKIPVNGGGLISLWKTLETLFSTGAMGKPGIPARLRICHPGLAPMAKTFIGDMVEVTQADPTDSMAVLLELD